MSRRATDHLAAAMARTKGEAANGLRRALGSSDAAGPAMIVVDGRAVSVAAAVLALREIGWTVHEPGTYSAKRIRSRMDDPHTSAQGARDVERRAGTQAHQLLKAYAHAARSPRLDGSDGLTDEEAHELAVTLEYLRPSGTRCYWKRCGELRDDGLLEVVSDGNGGELTRVGAAGSPRLVCRITPAGRRELERLEAPRVTA